MKATARPQAAPANPGLIGYLLFVASWFLHLPARVPALGALRIDMLLVAFLAVTAVIQKSDKNRMKSATDKWLVVLIAYAILSVPFVEWPGTVIKTGLLNFIKAVVFYYFTISFVRSEQDLRRFIFVFLGCQVLRVLEPVYLHLTEGYWGSQASMGGGGQFLDRLSGGPFDVVNPNGLAYIVCTILPLMYFLGRGSWKRGIGVVLVAPLLLYALALTGSRSGLIGLAIVAIGIFLKSKQKALIGALFVTITIGGFAMLSSDMQDRYLSIFGKGEKNAATADERVEGMYEQFHVVLHRPLFGHGLGTSPEANYHFTTAGPYGGHALPAHNLYLEVAQELGIFGLTIFLIFLKSILQGFLQIRAQLAANAQSAYVARLLNGMEVWLAMSLVFSFASYGLSSYDWYMFAGVAVVLQRLQQSERASQETIPATAHAKRVPRRNAASYTQIRRR